MTVESELIRWHLMGIKLVDDSRYVAVMSASAGHTREYLFRREPTTIGGRPVFGWDVEGWDEHTIYDRGSFKAVMDAVKAFHKASQQAIALGAGEDRKPRAGSRWRLAGINATADEARIVAVVSAPDGHTRDYAFARDPGPIWQADDWDRDTMHDRDAYEAVMNAVLAFGEARQREMALGDDEDRKPPGL